MKTIQDIRLADIHTPSIADDENIKAMDSGIDPELQKSIGHIPNIEIIHNLVYGQITDTALIDLLAARFHVDFYDPDLPLETRAELVLRSLDWHTRKGTPSVVEEIVTTVFSDAKVQEWFEYGGEPYTFKASTYMTDVSEESISKLIAAITSVKNVRSWLDVIEIIREAINMIYCGIGVAQTTTTRINAGFSVKIQRQNMYYASFTVTRLRVQIGGDGIV
jgi:phage tail P2-like protein